MNRSMCTLGVWLLLAGGALVETVQNRPALKDVFKDAFTMGTAVNNVIVSGRDVETRDLVLRHFASITADNVMKAGFVKGPTRLGRQAEWARKLAEAYFHWQGNVVWQLLSLVQPRAFGARTYY